MTYADAIVLHYNIMLGEHYNLALKERKKSNGRIILCLELNVRKFVNHGRIKLFITLNIQNYFLSNWIIQLFEITKTVTSEGLKYIYNWEN